MRTALATVLVAGVLVAVAFRGDATTASLSGGPESNPAPTEVVVTRGDRQIPVRCRPRRIGRAVMRWNRALNAADTETLRKFWKEERKGLRNDRRVRARGTFRWFGLNNSPSPTHEDLFVAYQPRRAVRYVRKRGGFRLQLTEVRGGAYRGRGILDGGATISAVPLEGAFQGRWILDDGRTYQVVGRASFRCKRRPFLIKVWNMQVLDPGEEFRGDVCPDPPGGTPPGTLISCAPSRSAR